MGMVCIVMQARFMQGKIGNARISHCTPRVFQIPPRSGSLNEYENDDEKHSIMWRLKSAVLSPDWISVGIKVHVPIFGDSGVKSSFYSSSAVCLHSV